MRKTLLLVIAFTSAFRVSAQQCGNCKVTPIVATYDLNMQVTPVKPGAKGWLEYLQLFWLSKHANGILYNDNKNCVSIKLAPDASQNLTSEDEIMKVGLTSIRLPNENYTKNYITTGYVKQTGDSYVMHLELQSPCNRKTIASTDVPFKATSSSEEILNIARQAANKLSPLVEKIRNYEAKERKENKKFAFGGFNRELIKITPARKNLITGETTDITIELNDCDGTPLEGREISFEKGSITGAKIDGTIGGTVTPSSVITDAKGKAKVKFKMTAKSGMPAIINAHTMTSTSENCEDAFIGSCKMDGAITVKVVVDYHKEGDQNFKMESSENRVGMAALSRRGWLVNYHFTTYYYPGSIPLKNKQVVIFPGMVSGEPVEEPVPLDEKLASINYATLKNGNELSYLFYFGNSSIDELESPLQLTESPFGAPEKEANESASYQTSQPVQPGLSFIFNENKELIYFTCSMEFLENDDGPSPLSGSFGIAKNDTAYFPIKPRAINDPSSIYKWEYIINYEKIEALNKGGTYRMNNGEKETATVRIFTTN